MPLPVLPANPLSTLQLVIEWVAMVAFALSGVFEAARKRMDPVGVVVVAFLTALGGGTLRDILLDRRPFFWVAHEWHLWLVLAVCVLSMLFLRARHVHLTQRAIVWPDALGLGLFAASGTQIALGAGMPGLIAALMGVITAAFGGLMRDMVCNEIPAVLNDHRPYALCAFAGAWVVVGCAALGLDADVGLLAGAVCTSGLRLLALATGFELRAWDLTQQHGSAGDDTPE